MHARKIAVQNDQNFELHLLCWSVTLSPHSTNPFSRNKRSHTYQLLQHLGERANLTPNLIKSQIWGQILPRHHSNLGGGENLTPNLIKSQNWDQILHPELKLEVWRNSICNFFSRQNLVLVACKRSGTGIHGNACKVFLMRSRDRLLSHSLHCGTRTRVPVF